MEKMEMMKYLRIKRYRNGTKISYHGVGDLIKKLKSEYPTINNSMLAKGTGLHIDTVFRWCRKNAGDVEKVDMLIDYALEHIQNTTITLVNASDSQLIRECKSRGLISASR